MATLDPPRALLIRALESAGDAEWGTVEALIRDHPDLLNAQNAGPAVMHASTVAKAEYLLSRGAHLEAVSKWWAGGMDTLRVAPDVGMLLVERGASLTAHVAAGLGWADRLAHLLDRDPSLIDAKGVDACTPLHFARNVRTAALLLDRGARVDARDEDHNSTPAQWLIRDVPQVVKFLLERGAKPDLFLAAALGDRRLAEQLIHSDPACLTHRIGDSSDFPPIGYQGRGGTIYQWTLAFNSYSHQIALLKGHSELFDYLYQQSDTPTRFLVSCLLARRSEAEAIATANPGLVASLPAADHELVARYCWETNTNYQAVKLMLDLGFPVAHPETSHGFSPLHNAAWAGSADLVDLLIARGHPVDLIDPRYNATPLGYAIHDCLVEQRHPEGDFGRVVKALLDAGSPRQDGVDEVLQRARG